MKKILLFLFMAFCLTTYSFGQTTIIDYETPETSSFFQLFDGGGPLEGVITEAEANPTVDAVNGSATVTSMDKNVDSPGWAGGFTDPQTAVDLTSDNQVCIKVLMPAIGNVQLKLEMSSTGGDDWEKAIPNTVVNGWEEICFDMTLPSDAAPNAPAFGHSYNRVVIFFDFFLTLSEDRTYYLDDIITKQGTATTEGDITFTVDMSEHPDPFTSVHVFGSFNSWNPADFTLTDNGDGTWSTTVPDLAIGTYEYKFFLDNDADNQQETLNRYSPCTVTFDDGMGGVFTNRKLVVTGDADLGTVCYGSCYACGEGANITFELGTSNIVVSPDGVFIAGGGNFGAPGEFPMTDPDGDGIYSITVERQVGFSSFYTFANGACGDFSCKEDISGQACADPNNFNDRFLDAVAGDVTVSTCFAQCTDSATDCGMAATAEVTFIADMTDYLGTITNMFVRGNMNGWGTDNPMTNIGNNRWSATLTLAAGEYEYKFNIEDGDTWEQFMEGDPCTVTPDGINTNRFIEVTEDVTVCYFWETCNTCEVGTNDLTIDHSLFSLQPSITSNQTTLLFKEDLIEEKQIKIFNTVGKLLQEITVEATATQQEISIVDFANGIYIISVQMGDTIGTQKLIKQ